MNSNEIDLNIRHQFYSGHYTLSTLYSVHSKTTCKIMHVKVLILTRHLLYDIYSLTNKVLHGSYNAEHNK